jgi:hypothetical protein
MRSTQIPFLILVALPLTACNLVAIGNKPTSRIPGKPTLTQPIPTNTYAAVPDCFLSFHLGAWNDMDGNGLWGVSERPLEGIKFHLNGTFAELWGYPYLSKADGWVTLTTWSPGECPIKDFIIIADSPELYEPTTPSTITISLTSGKSPFEVQFGFHAAAK